MLFWKILNAVENLAVRILGICVRQVQKCVVNNKKFPLQRR